MKSHWYWQGLVCLAFICLPFKVLAAAGPGITTQPQSQSVVLGYNAVYAVIASGQTPLFYQWSFNGTNLADSAHISGSTNATLTVSNVTAGDAGNYSVTVTNSHGSVTSSNAALTVLFPASITSQPTNQSVLLASNASFTVTATGTGTLSYQWQRAGTNLSGGGHFSGTTTPTLNIATIGTNDAGPYQVVVTNNYGAVTSSVATLTVLVPPFITLQPTNQAIVLTSNVTFSATAGGTGPLNYQWYFNGAPFSDGGRISGSATSSLIVADVQTNDAGLYQLVVTNNYGLATSVVATLTVLVPAAITSPPSNQVVSIGGTAIFSVTATGTDPLYYHWQKNGVNLAGNDRISGTTNSTLTISNVQTSDVGNYSVVVNNAYGTTASPGASLLVIPVVVRGGYSSANTNVPPAATNATAIAGGYEFSLALKSDGTVAGWGNDPSGQTDPPAGLGDVAAVAAGFNFGLALKDNGTVVGWGDNGSGQTNIPAGLSNAVAIAAGWYYGLALKDDGTVTGWGDNYFGQTNVPIGLTNVVAIAAGTASSLALKSDGTVIGWGFNYNGEINIPAGLSNVVAIAQGSYTGLALKSDGTVVGWGCCGGPDIPVGLSNVVAISVGELFDLALRSDGTVITWGSDYGESSISGLSNVVSVAAGRLHAVALVQNPAVQIAPSIRWQGPTNNTVPTGRTLVFHPYVTGSLPMKWQWFFEGTPLSGETNQWLVLPSSQPDQAGGYQFVASNDYGSVTSQVVTVFESPGFATQPANQSVLLGSNANFTVTPIGIGPFGYHWYFNGVMLTDGGRVSGSSTTNLNIANVQTNDAGTYQLVATNNFGATASMAATLTVLLPANVTVQPASQSVLLSNSVTFFASATGTAPLNYQWYFNGAPMSNSGRVSGTTATNLIVSNVQTSDAGSYQLIATNNYGSSTSMVATLTVQVPAIIAGQPANQSILIGSNVTFSAAVIGDAPLNFQWYFNGAMLTDGGRVSGSVTTNLNLAYVQTSDAGTYQLVATNNYGSTTSAVAALTVLLPANITVQPQSQSALLSNSVTFFSSATGTAPLNYRWYFNGVPMSNGGRVSGAMATNLIVSNVQTNDAGSYQLIATNNYGSSTSLVATLTVHVPAIIAGQPANQSILLSSNVTFSAAVIGDVPLSFQWYFNGALLKDGGRVSGSVTTNLNLANVQTTDAGTYQLVATNNYGSTTSAVATLTVLLAPAQITGQPASQAVLLGSNVIFTVTAIGSALNYQWYFNGSALLDGGRVSGSATASLNISNVQSSDAGGYRVIVSNLSNSVTSLTASLTPQAILAPSMRYVALTSTNPLSPYLDWTTAATNIQDAVDAAVAGDSVIVSNGTYNSGGRVVYAPTTNRLVVNKPVTVQSVNGPATTTIAVFYNPAGPHPTVRCVYLASNACLSGFTLLTGGTSSSGDVILGQSGGGVWCESSSAVVSNCVFNGNYAARFGGGAFGGTLVNCLLTNNTASLGGGACSNVLINCTLAKNVASYQSSNVGGGALSSTLSNCLLVANLCTGGGGGGAALSTLANCVLSNNIANYGGGLATSIAYSCLVSSNRAVVYGGGGYGGALINCILKNNSAARAGAGAYSSALTNCTVVSNAAGSYCVDSGTIANSIVYDNPGGNIIDSKAIFNTCAIPVVGPGCITNAPLFVNEAAGDFHLQSNSPCINAGNNAYVSVTNDFDGNPRIVGSTVDIGAYEYQSPASILSYAWAQQYGLPTDGSMDFTNLDGTGFNVYQDWLAGLNPTNPASVLALQAPAATNNAAGITVTWQSVNTRTYYLQRSSDLMQPFSAIVSNIVGQAGTTSYTDTSATNAVPYFYRVGVQ